MLGVKDVDLMILENLNDKDLFNFCLTSSEGRKLCNDENFWRNRFVKRFGYHEKSETRSWKNFYLSLIYNLTNSEYRGNMNMLMRETAKGGMKNIDLINYFIYRRAKDWNAGMAGAAEGGHRDLVEFFIKKGADSWNMGMHFAAYGGHQNLIDFFISKGANDWNDGMEGAAEGGHRDLVDFFISQGATDWNMPMYYAAKGGHRELVDFFISQGAWEWNLGLMGAKKGGHQDLVEFFKQKLM